MMFLKKWRINRLRIKQAKYETMAEISEKFTKGDTNSYFIDNHIENTSKLAEIKEKLSILEG